MSFDPIHRVSTFARSVILALFVTGFVCSGFVAAETAKATCPVNAGADIDFNISFDAGDGPVYFCCKGCCGKFAKEPAKYAEGVKAQRLALAKTERVQLCCPISNQPCKAEFAFDYEGQKVFFCCGDCCATFAKDPAAHFGSLLKISTFQTKCPVSGSAIDPKVSFDLEGNKVHFCCGDCCAAFAKEPAKYLPALAEQGYKIQLAAAGATDAESAPAEKKVEAAETAEPAKATCAVNPGADIDFSISFDAGDGPVYFCCKGCCGKFAKDPEKYAEGVKAQRKALAAQEKVQLCCPISNQPCKAEFAFEHEGQKVYFCCGDCCATFAKDPAAHIGALLKISTFQTKCPVSGSAIDPKVSFDLEGNKVYFCCGDCCAAFAKEPAKYLPALAEQGYKIVLAAKEEPKKEEPKKEEVPAKEVEAEKKVDAEPTLYPKCPVMTWEDAEFALSLESDQGPLFFSSKAAREAYQANPDKYAAGVQAQRNVVGRLDKVQVLCPVSRKPIDPTKSTEHEGEKVSFCCGDCCAAFVKDPAAHATGLANSFTHQTLCPVSGSAIDPTAAFDVGDGVNVYFCCKDCCGKFAKDPAAYARNLYDQGIDLRVVGKTDSIPASGQTAPAPAPAPAKQPEKKSPKPAEEGKVASAEAITCPVHKGAKVDFTISFRTDEGPVYFCCKDCCGKFASDPSSFDEPAKAQRLTLASLDRVQLCCPLSGQPCNPEIAIDYAGQKVSFCCGDCCKTFSEDPAKYVGKLLSVSTFQTKCPVSGKPVNAQASLDVAGTQVRFCCQGCLSEFKKRPEKYLDNLKAQGYSLDVAQLAQN